MAVVGLLHYNIAHEPLRNSSVTGLRIERAGAEAKGARRGRGEERGLLQLDGTRLRECEQGGLHTPGQLHYRALRQVPRRRYSPPPTLFQQQLQQPAFPTWLNVLLLLLLLCNAEGVFQ